jgi:hypothetical protein
MRLGSWGDLFCRPARQYLLGVIAGLGLGVVFGSYLSLGWHPAVIIPGLALSAFGSYAARADCLAARSKEPRRV